MLKLESEVVVVVESTPHVCGVKTGFTHKRTVDSDNKVQHGTLNQDKFLAFA